MPDPALPPGLLAAIAAVTAWLDDAGSPGMIVGGIAASLLGRPRLTQDVDALTTVPEGRWPALLDAARFHGLEPRIDAPLQFAARTRVLLMRHRPSGIDVDLMLGGLQFELDAVAAAVPHAIGATTVRLPRVEDLMIMKAIAHRPRDVLDLEALLDLHPDADIAHVRRFLVEFARSASMPSIIESWDRLLSRRGPGVHEPD